MSITLLILIIPLSILLGCKKDISFSGVHLKQTNEISESATLKAPSPSPRLANTDDKTCTANIEIIKDSIFYTDFELYGSGTIMPLRTVFKNCDFKIEDISKHIYYFNDNGAIKKISINTLNNNYPPITNLLLSYCAFYFINHQSNFPLYTETFLKNGTVIKGQTFNLELSVAHIKYCEEKGPKVVF